MFDLTEQQCLELSGPEPIAVDPVTHATYVLVRREAYDPDEGAAFINDVMAEDDAKDPYLQGYQHFGTPACFSL